MGVHVDRFAVMGTTAEVTVVGGDPSLLTVARGRLRDLEQRWSRFRPESEVSLLNAAGGRPVRVSAETIALVDLARAGAVLTEGRFNPLVLDAMEALGYAVSFELMGRRAVPGRSACLPADADAIVVDTDARTVTLPRGARFDPGGIGKGLAADLVAEELRALGATGAGVNVGGDLRVTGASPGSGDAWLVAVRDRPEDEPVAHVAVRDGAVATTSRSRRRWTTDDGAARHHVVDPRTGVSASTPVRHATAIASTGWRAEVLSTIAFLDGAAALALAERLGATAMAATADDIVTGPGWRAFAHDLEPAA